VLRITKQTDYGIVLMTHLAQSEEPHHSAPELAETLRIPLPMVSKILKILTRDGLLASHRGVPRRLQPGAAAAADHGRPDRGLARGAIAMTECVEDHHDCARESFCAVRGNWQVINGAIQNALSRHQPGRHGAPDRRGSGVPSARAARGLRRAGIRRRDQ
jgi:DNA-binding IscR family transcriptional regulator